MDVHEVQPPRAPRYGEAADLYQRGQRALAAAEGGGLSPQAVHGNYVAATALFAGAQAAAALRLIVPVNVVAGVTDTGR